MVLAEINLNIFVILKIFIQFSGFPYFTGSGKHLDMVPLSVKQHEIQRNIVVFGRGFLKVFRVGIFLCFLLHCFLLSCFIGFAVDVGGEKVVDFRYRFYCQFFNIHQQGNGADGILCYGFQEAYALDIKGELVAFFSPFRSYLPFDINRGFVNEILMEIGVVFSEESQFVCSAEIFYGCLLYTSDAADEQ